MKKDSKKGQCCNNWSENVQHCPLHSKPKWKGDSMTDKFWSTGKDVDGYLIGEGEHLLEDTEIIERLYKLAEYENDEVPRRRADLLTIRTLEQRVDGLDQIAEDALWHDGHDNPEALEDIRKTLKSLGYTQAAILAKAEEEA